MEIKDRMALLWRRLWLVLLVPLVAGSIVATLEWRRPDQYRATATVAVPGLLSGEDRQYSGTNGTRAYVANLIAVAESRAVAEAVAAETGVALTSIRSGLRVTPVGESSVVKIAYRTQRSADAVPVARAVATHSLAAVFKPGLDRARELADGARKQAADADAAIEGFVAETKLVDPDRAFQVKSQQASALEAQAVAAGARGDAETSAVLARAAVTARREMDALAPLQARYRTLVQTRDRAVTQLESAEAALAVADERLRASDPARAVTDSGSVQVDQVADATTKVAATMAAGLFLVVLALFAVDSAFRSKDEEMDIMVGPPRTPVAAG